MHRATKQRTNASRKLGIVTVASNATSHVRGIGLKIIVVGRKTEIGNAACSIRLFDLEIGQLLSGLDRWASEVFSFFQEQLNFYICRVRSQPVKNVEWLWKRSRDRRYKTERRRVMRLARLTFTTKISLLFSAFFSPYSYSLITTSVCVKETKMEIYYNKIGKRKVERVITGKEVGFSCLHLLN